MKNYLTDFQLEAIQQIQKAELPSSLRDAIDRLDLLQKTGDYSAPIRARLDSRMARYHVAGRNHTWEFFVHMIREERLEEAKLIVIQELVRILLTKNETYPHPQV